MGGDIKYTCSNGSWGKTGNGKCINSCIGSPNFIDNSKLYTTSGSNVGHSGTFHNINTDEVMTPTTNNVSSLYAENGAILDADCKSGYAEIYLADSAYNTNNGNRKDWGHYYYCDNGTWKAVSKCVLPCNNISPIYDVNDNKISEQLFGTYFANNSNGRNYYTYQACYKNSDSGSVYTLNTNGTGLGNMNPKEYVVCGRSSADLIEYHDEPARKLVCTHNNGKTYWKFSYSSCDLGYLKNLSGINIYLAYNGVEKILSTVMTSGAKQTRFTGYYRKNTGYDPLWSRPYVTSTNDKDVVVQCKEDGTWKISY